MVPDTPQKSTRRLIFALFVLGSMLLGVVLPTVIDLTDRKIKTTDEFEAILGFPPLGVALGSNGTGQEAMRRIALGIMREWRTSGIRSFILTSVRHGGNANLALALADELADLGVRTVAIEASLTRSNARYLTPSSAGQGVGRVSARDTRKLVPRVANTGALNVRVQPTPQNGSDMSLQRAQNGGVPSTFGYVRETVNHALGNHDIVLLAAPPLLSSADTIAMIQMPAGAILVARAGRDDVIEVAAAVRELERCAPPVVGAIICGNGHRNGDGGYPFDLELDGADSSATSFFYGLAAK